uniref:EF-hand domain-containing protein n=1 Tax=Haptolina brevifila TaxID=156173 RepID=A0A7S2MGS8_9EUKA
MADLITHGTATKIAPKTLPSTAAKMALLNMTEQNMPGDLAAAAQATFGQMSTAGFDAMPAIQRIAKQVRTRNLDMLNLMDDFIKRPRGSKMPTRNRAFLDVSTFRRALCYAMGDQWTGLNITSSEFEDLFRPYIRADANHESRLGNPQAILYPGVGQPEVLVLWQQFAQDVQLLADGSGRNPAEQALWEAEQELANKSSAAAKAAEAMTDADGAFGIANAAMREKQAARAEMMAKPIGKRGCTVGQIEHAKKVISDKLLQKHDTVREALKDLDESADGILSREEVLFLLNENYIMKFVDFYTGQTRGQLDEEVVHTLLDLVDKNNDGNIDYDEFSKVVMSGANTYFGGTEDWSSSGSLNGLL